MYLCNFVFLNLVFQHWAQVYNQIFRRIAVFSIESRFKGQIFSNASERKNDRLLTSHQILVILYFNVVCIVYLYCLISF